MTNRQFYSWQTDGGADDVVRLVALLEQQGCPWCMIGGLAVNHWALEPMVTKDVDLVIATENVAAACAALAAAGYEVKQFPFSINCQGSSKLSIQLSTDAMYQAFPARSVPADIHGILMRVACLEDTLAGKLAAYNDRQRRPSKRQKDLTDIARLVEAHPELEPLIPVSLLTRIRE